LAASGLDGCEQDTPSVILADSYEVHVVFVDGAEAGVSCAQASFKQGNNLE
jgi:hypothetical protein